MKNKIVITIILSIISAMALTIYLMYSENLLSISKIRKLKYEINNKDLNYKNKLESLNNSTTESLLKIDSLKKINDNQEIQGFETNGKSISVEELLKTFNKTLEENSELSSQIATNVRVFEYLEKDYGISIIGENGKITIKKKSESNIKKGENECVDKLKIIKNELDEKVFLLKQLDNRYKLKYEVKTEGNTIKSTIYNSKVDSALWLYPYYKHKIKVDKNGNVFIK